MAGKLELTIHHYIAGVAGSKDMEKLHAGALPWLRTLPKRFQDEFEGMAEGADIPLQLLAEWAYIEECDAKQRSGAIYLSENQAWVSRNNDFYVPELMLKRFSVKQIGMAACCYWLWTERIMSLHFLIACVRNIIEGKRPITGSLGRSTNAPAKT